MPGSEAKVPAAPADRDAGPRRRRRLTGRLLYVNTWPAYLNANWPGLTGWDVAAGQAISRDVLHRARRTAPAAEPGVVVDTGGW